MGPQCRLEVAARGTGPPVTPRSRVAAVMSSILEMAVEGKEVAVMAMVVVVCRWSRVRTGGRRSGERGYHNTLHIVVVALFVLPRRDKTTPHHTTQDEPTASARRSGSRRDEAEQITAARPSSQACR